MICSELSAGACVRGIRPYRGRAPRWLSAAVVLAVAFSGGAAAQQPPRPLFSAVPVSVLRGAVLPETPGTRRERIISVDVARLRAAFDEIEETQYTFQHRRGGIPLRLNFFRDVVVDAPVRGVDDMDGGGRVWATLVDGDGVLTVILEPRAVSIMLRYPDRILVAAPVLGGPYYLVREISPGAIPSPD